jgi:hypothetical protein
MEIEVNPSSNLNQSQKEVSFLLQGSMTEEEWGWKQRRMYLAMNSDLRPLAKFVCGVGGTFTARSDSSNCEKQDHSREIGFPIFILDGMEIEPFLT